VGQFSTGGVGQFSSGGHKNVEQRLPALSTYLGHACVRDTYWYLSACPELMEEAARRLDRRWEATP
jgi:integrase/recombinase XerD